ncbi:MAG: acetyl-CoA carboxylase carboxyl transferase subunit alpha, partial [Bacteroidetes bacterium]|nr:acetyl-CoA carboxylase carboxyl transferase subunit alpha [Bacteroidota bacterium]
MPIYLDFEEPIKELREQLEKTLEIEEVSKVDVKQTVDELQKKIKETTKEIYSNLTPWQRVQVSRHPERPYTLSYIKAITEGNFIELHGDRTVKDDKAMVGGLGQIGDET